MKIAIDLRSLSSGRVSGIENYCLNLIENLPLLDKQNQYLLFYNALGRRLPPDFHYVNSQVKKTKYPNKLLNLALKLNLINLEQLTGPTDWLFMPNLSQFSVNPQTKLAITVHDLSPVVTPEFYDLKRKLWHKFLNYKKAFERANVLFAVSEYTKKDLVKIFGVSPEKVKVIYPAVDHKIFNPNIPDESLRLARNLYGLPGDFILFLNTIEPRKNLANLIKAFEQLDHPAHLVIAGRLGWKYEGDFELISKSKKSAKIKYIGYVAETNKPALIKLAKILVYPSFYEGFGFQPLEAMAIGTPVVVSQVASLPEVSGGSALMVNPYSVADIHRGIFELLKNPELAARLSAQALIRARDFTWQKTAEQVLYSLNSL